MRKLLSIVKQKTEVQAVDITMKFTLSALWNLTGIYRIRLILFIIHTEQHKRIVTVVGPNTIQYPFIESKYFTSMHIYFAVSTYIY